MSRAVTTYERAMRALPELAAKAEQQLPPEDKYKDRLLKYVPAEVVTLYVTLTALAGTSPSLPAWIGWAIFAVGLVATPFYLRVMLDVSDGIQIAISTIAFIVWVFALGGPFTELSWYRPIYGGLLLPIFTFFVAGIKTAPQPAP